MEDTFREIVDYVPSFMEDEDRKDAEFRLAVFGDQLGGLLREHDERDEIGYGDAFFQYFCLLETRGIDIADVVDTDRKSPESVLDDVVRSARISSVILEEKGSESLKVKVMERFGRVARHISHDPDLNPQTRPLDEDEGKVYWELLQVLFSLAVVEGVDVGESLEIGLERCRNREGYKQQGEESLQGQVVMGEGTYTGVADKDILVFREFTVEDTRKVDPEDVNVIVTEIGGVTSHAAQVAREYGIPCIVGAKDAAEKISVEEEVTVDLDEGRVLLD